MENHYFPNYEERKAALIEEIIAAFDGVSREGGVSLSEADVIDDYGSDTKRLAARLSDTDTRWQDVPDEQLAGHWPISFLDPIGFRYYMPAFLLYCLRHSNEYGENESYELDYHLSLSRGRDKDGLDEYSLSRFRLLTSAQSRAIARFLQLEADRRDAWDLETEHFQIESEIDEEFEKWQIRNARKEAEKRARMSPKEIEEREREHEQRLAQHNSPHNDARYALEKYWGRFL